MVKQLNQRKEKGAQKAVNLVRKGEQRIFSLTVNKHGRL